MADKNLKSKKPNLDHDEFYARVSELAYLKAEQRGFDQGQEWDDWLEAERELGGQWLDPDSEA